MKNTTSMLSLAVVASFSLIGASADAALISIAPGDVTASSQITHGCCGARMDDKIVDGSGLSGATHDVNPDNMWLSSGAGPFGGVDLNPTVTFDLGGVYTITSFNVWNYNETQPNFPDRGINDVTVAYGTTAALGSTVPGITNFARATGLATYTGEAFNAFTPFNARYIQFDIASNHGDSDTFYGLSEVQFDGVLVPEPSAVALLGLGGLALLRRRRK